MEQQSDIPFPYTFENITPEEQKYVDKVFGLSNGSVYRFSRVGPKGFNVCKPYEKEAANIYNMPLRPTDVFVASYQRSGTTWTQELVWLLANNLDYDTSAAMRITQRYPFLDHFMFYDLERLDVMVEPFKDKADMAKKAFTMMAEPALKALAAVPHTTRRFVKTHVPMSLLPPKLLETAKVVYVARDPRDVAVSCYHQARLFQVINPPDFKEFWKLFQKGYFMFSPILEHVKEAWELRNHPNMLFLFYEDLSKDLRASIRRVADFFGKTLNEEEMERLCDHLDIKNFKKNKSVNYDEVKELGLLASDESFIRKGKAGGWREYFDEEMTRESEQWIADGLRDTDLRYPHMTNLN